MPFPLRITDESSLGEVVSASVPFTTVRPNLRVQSLLTRLRRTGRKRTGANSTVGDVRLVRRPSGDDRMS